jgi:hypothetical protein
LPTGRETQLTKQVGEYLVAAELCRMGLISTTFTGNVPEFDILAINEKHKTIPIQVKAIQGASWQFDAKKFVDIKPEEGVQIIRGKTKPHYMNLIYILVKLRGQGKDEFYILKFKDLQSIIYKAYKKFIEAQGGRRPKNPESTHTAVWPSSLERYRDNWR